MIKKCRSLLSSFLFLGLFLFNVGCEIDDNNVVNNHNETSQSMQLSKASQNFVLNPVADAYVNSTSKSKNYGTRSQLLIDSSPRVYRTFIKFSVPVINSEIQSVKPRLNIFDKIDTLY